MQMSSKTMTIELSKSAKMHRFVDDVEGVKSRLAGLADGHAACMAEYLNLFRILFYSLRSDSRIRPATPPDLAEYLNFLK